MIKNLIGMRGEGEGEEGEDTNNMCLEILVVPLSEMCCVVQWTAA